MDEIDAEIQAAEARLQAKESVEIAAKTGLEQPVQPAPQPGPAPAAQAVDQSFAPVEPQMTPVPGFEPQQQTPVEQQRVEPGHKPWADLDEQRQAYIATLERDSAAAADAARRAAQLQHDVDSANGRVGAMQKQINELQAEREKWLEQQQQQAESPDAWRGYDDLRTLAEHWDDPEQGHIPGSEIARTIYSTARRMARDIAAQAPQPQPQPVQQTGIDRNEVRQMTRDELDVMQRLAALAELHPDYREITSNEDWNNWLAGQDYLTRAGANSPNPDDVALVMDFYKQDRGIQQPMRQQTQDAQALAGQAPQQAAPLTANPQQYYGMQASPYGPQQQPQADQQPLWRQRQLAGAQALPRSVAPYQTPQNGVEMMTDDEFADAAWAAAEQRMQERERRF